MKSLLHRPLHCSWKLSAISLGVLGGLLLARQLGPTVLVADGLALIIASSCVVLAVRRPAAWLILLALLGGGLLGLLRGQTLLRSARAYTVLQHTTCLVRGTLSDDPALSLHGDQQMTLQAIRLNGDTAPGTIWLSSRHPLQVRRGDTITVTGTLSPGFGGSAASMYRADAVSIERYSINDHGGRVRDAFAGLVRRSLPAEEASLGLGFLTGQHANLTPELTTGLRAAGLTHAVVASGYNLTVLVSLARRILGKVSLFAAASGAVALLLGFVLIAGLSPSMVRAALAATLSLVAWYYGRSIHPGVLLSCIAALTAYANPWYVWGTIAWFLSFSSFFGVLVLAPLLHQYFWGSTEPGLIRRTCIETLAAQAVTLPISLYVFGSFSRFALIANLLVVPLIPLAMATTAFAGIAGGLAPPLAALCGWPAYWLLHFMLYVVRRVAALPDALSDWHISAIGCVLFYACLLLLCAWLRHQTSYRFRNHNQQGGSYALI